MRSKIVLPGTTASQTGHRFISPEREGMFYRVSVPVRGRRHVRRFKDLADAIEWRDGMLRK
jgi:hypothetical protein